MAGTLAETPEPGEARELLERFYEQVKDAPDPANELARVLGSCRKEDAYDWSGLISGFEQQLSYGLPAFMNALLKRLLSANYPEEVFYTKLWGQIDDNELFETEDDRFFALLHCLLDHRLPYRRYELVSMENEEYVEAQKRLQKERDQLVCIANRDFPQRTEEASAVLEIIESCSEKQDRVVLLSLYLAFVLAEEEDDQVDS